jgi:hypothetical protein
MESNCLGILKMNEKYLAVDPTTAIGMYFSEGFNFILL